MIFGKKDPAKNAEKEARKQAIKARADELKSHLTRVEMLTSPTAIQHTASQLDPSESVLLVILGEEEESDAHAVLVCTDQRILVGTAKGFKLGSIVLPYEKVDRVDVGRSLRGAFVNLFNGSQITRIEKALDSNDAHLRIRDVIETHKASSVSRESSSNQGGVSDLKHLADLHAQGILTDEEFAAAKAKALGL